MHLIIIFTSYSTVGRLRSHPKCGPLETIASLKTRLKCISYHFLKIWNSDQLPEQVYQPLGTQDDCGTVLDNYSQVMIEIHHGGKLFLIIDEALLLGMGP